jgi:hypothetical protein
MKLKILCAVVFLLSIAGNIFLLSGCKTFDMQDYVIEGQPDECNDYYITIGAYAHSENKDFAFPATLYEGCKTARASKKDKKIEALCKRIYFPDSEVSKKSENYVEYLECLKD